MYTITKTDYTFYANNELLIIFIGLNFIIAISQYFLIQLNMPLKCIEYYLYLGLDRPV